MPIKKAAAKHLKLNRIIEDFNKTPEQDRIRRLFLLQKINYYIQSKPVFQAEFSWIMARDKDSWRNHLEEFGINPDGSFLFKGMQFAREVAKEAAPGTAEEEVDEDQFYQLLQERDKLLQVQMPYKEITAEEQKRYLQICCQLACYAAKNPAMKEKLETQTQILSLAKDKFSAIKGETEKNYVNPKYRTEVLGTKQVNNFNFIFMMEEWPDDFVIRVEDRFDLGFEQELHSYPVAKDFADDFALFIMHFKSENSEQIEYKPVVLSQFANQGSLDKVAGKLKGESQQTIAERAIFYFEKINHFCLRLKEAQAFHPDMKLSNFLVHNNKLMISDRKALTRSPSPLARDLRSTPRYAPPEYLNCLDDECENYLPNASTTHIDVEQLMSYQMGKALKEFLIITQLGHIPEPGEEETALIDYFNPIHPTIINLTILIDELTRFEAGKRLSIEKFHHLLPYCNQKPDIFFSLLEKEFSSKELGIELEMNEIYQLLDTKRINNKIILEQANRIFNAVRNREPREARLDRMAIQLSIKCYQECSENYFAKISQKIETALLKADWKLAPWWRQIFHVLSFGLYRVDRLAKLDKVVIDLDFNDLQFKTHLSQLEFLPPGQFDSLGLIESDHLKDYLKQHINAKNERSSELKPDIQPAGGSKTSPKKKDKTRSLTLEQPLPTAHSNGTYKESEQNNIEQKSNPSAPEITNAPVIPQQNAEKAPRNKKPKRKKKTASLPTGTIVVKEPPVPEKENPENTASLSSSKKQVIQSSLEKTVEPTAETEISSKASIIIDDPIISPTGTSSKKIEKRSEEISSSNLLESREYYNFFRGHTDEKKMKSKQRSIRHVRDTLFRGEFKAPSAEIKPPINQEKPIDLDEKAAVLN